MSLSESSRSFELTEVPSRAVQLPSVFKLAELKPKRSSREMQLPSSFKLAFLVFKDPPELCSYHLIRLVTHIITFF